MPRTPRSALSKRALRKSKPKVKNSNIQPEVHTTSQLKSAQRRNVNITSVHENRLISFRYPLENGQLMSAKGARFLIAPCMRCLCGKYVTHYEVPIPKDPSKKASVWGGKQVAVCPNGKHSGCGFFVCFDTIRARGPLVIKTNDYSLLPGGVHAEDDVLVHDGYIHYDPTGRFTHVNLTDEDAEGDDDPDHQPTVSTPIAAPVTG
ncbi:hypothetical protein PQX77_011842, partial [Marasmius sp. AFHP31]